MLTYCVLKNSKSNDIEVVETGFSFLAFVFGPFWGLFKKLWLFSFIGLIILFSFKFLFQNFDNSILAIPISLSSSFFWGFFARDLYIQDLILRNFKPTRHVIANSKENALIKYLSEEN